MIRLGCLNHNGYHGLQCALSGEANRGNAAKYGCALKAMVENWRLRWSEETSGTSDAIFPFGQVQV